MKGVNMDKHDEFDLDVRFMDSGDMGASEHQGEQIGAYTGKATCPGYHTDCGTCAGDTRPCATCETNCGNTCLNTCQTCAADTGGCQGCNQPPPPLTATLSGGAGIDFYDSSTPNDPTWANMPTARVSNLTLSLTFSGDRRSVSLNPSSFQFNLYPPPLDYIEDTITAHLSSNGTGSFTSASGSMQIPVAMTLDHSFVPLLLDHPTATFILTTGQASTPDGRLSGSGENMDSFGQVTLYGALQTQSGLLDYFIGLDLEILIAGTISPHP